MYDHEQQPVFSNPKCNPAVFIFTMVFIIERQMARVTKNRRRLLKSELVSSDISGLLVWIPIEYVLQSFLPIIILRNHNLSRSETPAPAAPA